MIRVNTKALLHDHIQNATLMYEMHKDITCEAIKTPKKRSLPQNDISHAWYLELARQGDMTFDEYRTYCKYKFGLGIMLEGNDKQKETFKRVMKSISYEDRLAIVSKMAVTSTFKKAEMAKYLDLMQQHFTGQGFILTNKESF